MSESIIKLEAQLQHADKRIAELQQRNLRLQGVAAARSDAIAELEVERDALIAAARFAVKLLHEQAAFAVVSGALEAALRDEAIEAAESKGG